MTPRMALAGQAVVVLLLAAALWDPGLPGLAPVHLVVLIDDSASMSRAGSDAAWRALSPAVADLPKGSRLSLVRFGGTARAEATGLPADAAEARALLAAHAPPRRLPVSEGQTDVAAALGVGLALHQPGLAPVLLLASDGAPTMGDTAGALRNAAVAGVPVLWWEPPVATGGPDAWIARLAVPSRAPAGKAVHLTALLGADTAITAALEVQVDGRLAFRRSLALEAGAPAAVTLDLDLPAGGPHEVTAALVGGDRLRGNDRRSAIIERDGPARVVLVSPRSGASAVARSLQAGSWPIVAVRPGDFTPALLGDADVLVLEEVAVGHLPEADWAVIARAVRTDGIGLLVLGGPDTFAAGGYRHSTLEGLLPVLAEPPRPQPPAAVVFAVDSSGSMARPDGAGAPSHTLARRAVAGSAASLTAADEAALIAFDADARTLLPLSRRADQAAAVEAGWDPRPGGGTRIGPALDQALTLLGASEAPQRLLVLATDGRFSDTERLPGLAARLSAAEVTLITIAIGDGADLAALKTLTGSSADGRLLRAADTLELPVLMQTEVQARRAALRQGPVTPEILRPLPFEYGTGVPWPAVDALQVTRPRADAPVYLAADAGEPLLAAAFSGTGRVAVLPAGVDSWAEAWMRWPGWGPFLGGLIQWTAGDAVDRRIAVSAFDGPDALELTIEALGPHGDWAGPAPMPVGVRDPAGRWQRLAAKPEGPGRYRLRVPADQPGRYDLVAGAPGQEQRLALFHEPMQELIPGDGPPGLASFAAGGLLERWSPRTALPKAPRSGSARPWLAALGLALFLVLLAAERVRVGATGLQQPFSPNRRKGRTGRAVAIGSAQSG